MHDGRVVRQQRGQQVVGRFFAAGILGQCRCGVRRQVAGLGMGLFMLRRVRWMGVVRVPMVLIVVRRRMLVVVLGLVVVSRLCGVISMRRLCRVIGVPRLGRVCSLCRGSCVCWLA